MNEDLSQVSLLELFRMEADSQIEALTSGLRVLERDPTAADQLDLCMRAAHSLKGAATIIDLEIGVRVAHVMEDCLVGAQHGRVVLGREAIAVLLGATDLLSRVANMPEDGAHGSLGADVDACLETLARVLEAGGS